LEHLTMGRALYEQLNSWPNFFDRFPRLRPEDITIIDSQAQAAKAA
jgi:hypothetical protein